MQQEVDQIIAFMNMVEDAKYRLPALATELGANEYYTSFEIEQERDNKQIEFSCSIHLSFGKWNNYHCSSYVSATHGYEAAVESIKEMHASWAKDQAKYELKRQEDEIKNKLYQDYLKQTQK